ncbi:MAG: hypothetical protein ACI3VA_13020 [Candidatus Limivicinus sp.]
MNDRERQNSKKNPSGGKGILAVIGFIVLMNVISAGGGRAILFILAIALIAAVVIIAVKAGKKAAQKNSAASAPVRWSRPDNDRRQNAPKQPERPVYTPQAVYNENASAENFQRDRQRRIAQLDGFLKNGIIDKEEYKVLLSRYERDI